MKGESWEGLEKLANRKLLKHITTEVESRKKGTLCVIVA